MDYHLLLPLACCQCFSRITFVGGEPFLHPLIDDLIVESRAVGLVTAAVTNGSCLSVSRLESLAPSLDWLAFSVDASTDELHAQVCCRWGLIKKWFWQGSLGLESLGHRTCSHIRGPYPKSAWLTIAVVQNKYLSHFTDWARPTT